MNRKKTKPKQKYHPILLIIIVLSPPVLLIGCMFLLNYTFDTFKETRVEVLEKDPNYEAEGFIKRNEKLEIDYVKHNKDNEYALGVVKNKKLEWITVEVDDAILEDGLKKSYLYRPEDTKVFVRYELHIAPNQKIEGGTYKERYMTQGSRSYYRDVQTEMIVTPEQ